jgi:tetratricopeptide (TPR) repeat protein
MRCTRFPVLFAILCFAAQCAVGGQAAPARTPEERANQSLASAIELTAAGDIEGALRLLSNLAGTSAVPDVVQRARCLAGGTMAMNEEIPASEQVVQILNRAAGSQQGKQIVTECTRQLEALAPRLPPARRAGLFYFLGMVGTDEEAHLRFLREAVKLRPDFGQAGYQLGVHLLAFGQMEEAAGLFRKVAEQHPEWAEPRANLGVVFNLTGRPAEAVRELREALKVQPNYAQAHGQLGLALYLTGQYDEAADECSRALRAEPDNAFHYNCAAVVLLEKNRDSEALAYARRASELAPSHETFLVVFAAAQLAAGQQTEARDTMRRAITVQPRLKSDSTRLEKADLLRGRALALARQLLEKTAKQ